MIEPVVSQPFPSCTVTENTLSGKFDIVLVATFASVEELLHKKKYPAVPLLAFAVAVPVVLLQFGFGVVRTTVGVSRTTTQIVVS